MIDNLIIIRGSGDIAELSDTYGFAVILSGVANP